MSLQENQRELRQLDDLGRRFQQALRRTSQGARFRRSDGRAAALGERLRRTRAYLELALGALEGRGDDDEGGSVGQAGADEGAEGWLVARVRGLASYLAGGVQEREGGELPTREGDHQPSDVPVGRGLEGDCRTLAVPDLLATLQALGKTGVLRIEHADENVVLHLEQGQLVHAYSENPPSGARLGEVLVEQGVLSKEELADVLSGQSAAAPRLGDLLRRGDAVSAEALEQGLQRQVQELFHRLYTYEAANFTFDPRLPEGGAESRARRNVLHLLLESARVSDERRAS